MKSYKKYSCIAVVAVLAMAGITGCGWWKNTADQVEDSNTLSASSADSTTEADSGERKKNTTVSDETQKLSKEISDGTGVISAPEILIEQDATACNGKNGVDNSTGNQNSDNSEQKAASGELDDNGNGNRTDSSHDEKNNTENGSDNFGNNDSGNQGNNGGNGDSGNQENNSVNEESENQGNNDGNKGSNDKGNNGGNAGSEDRGNTDDTATGDQGDNNGNGNEKENGGNTGIGGSQGVELPEISIN